MRNAEKNAVDRSINEVLDTIDSILENLRAEKTRLLAQKAALDMIKELFLNEKEGE